MISPAPNDPERMTLPSTAPATRTVLPAGPERAAAPAGPWGPPAPPAAQAQQAVRGALACVAGLAGWLASPVVYSLFAFVLTPACSTSTPAPLALQGVTIAVLLLSFILPVAIAGRRMWWVGIPIGLLTTAGNWQEGMNLLLEPQSGFCF